MSPPLLFGLRSNCWPMTPLESPGHSQAILVQCPTAFQSQIPWVFSVPLLNPQVGKSVVGPRLLTVWKFLWYNFSAVFALTTPHTVVGLSATSSQRACFRGWVTQVCIARASVPVAGHCWPYWEPLYYSIGKMFKYINTDYFLSSQNYWWVHFKS